MANDVTVRRDGDGPGRVQWSSAVVVGGSIAGSLVARVLSDYFGSVIVLDRDEFPDRPANRSGVPQGPHFHGLLARGREVCEELLPGFVNTLIAEGAPVTSLQDAKIYMPYGWAPRIETPPTYVRATRPLLEWVVRDKARAIPGVQFVEGATVVGYLQSGGRVHGVTVSRGAESATQELHADLIVDTTGRSGQGLRWLEALGWPLPASTAVNAHWGYSSRMYRLPEGAVDAKSVGGFPLGAAGTGPTKTRGGHLMLQERGNWLLTLSGCAKDYPPTNEVGFHEFAATLAFPDIAEALRVAEPLTDIIGWRSTTNRLFGFESVPSRPEGLVFIGDSVCSFNPVYGQGMTVAALGAVDLRTELEVQLAEGRDGSLDGLAHRYQGRLAETIRFPWMSACGADYRVPGVEGAPQPEEAHARNAFTERLAALGGEDPDIFLKLMETQQMVRPANWMQGEDIRRRVLDDWDRLGRMVGLAA